MKKILRLRHRKKISNPTTTIESSIWFSAPSPPWINLPTDVTANILHRLGPVEILESAEKVCATWWKVCHEDPSMWRVIDMIDPADEKDSEISRFLTTRWCRITNRRSNSGDKKDLSKISAAATMCCRAVDRSQGGLIDISIGHFCTDNLLRYVSDRSSRLKCLTISSRDISGRGLIEAIKKFGGELEELRLFYTPSITAQDIETIGICCPLLNTFTFNNSAHRFPSQIVDDGRALAIAKNMPNLRHLELFFNAFTEKGLQAILDGCPCLESLDLRRTSIYGWEGDRPGNSYLEDGDLKKRCSWIKDLRLPSESSWQDDYESDDDEFDCQKGDWYCHVNIGLKKARMNCRTGTFIFE